MDGSPRAPCGPVTVNSSSHREAEESYVIRGAKVRRVEKKYGL